MGENEKMTGQIETIEKKTLPAKKHFTPAQLCEIKSKLKSLAFYGYRYEYLFEKAMILGCSKQAKAAAELIQRRNIYGFFSLCSKLE